MPSLEIAEAMLRQSRQTLECLDIMQMQSKRGPLIRCISLLPMLSLTVRDAATDLFVRDSSFEKCFNIKSHAPVSMNDIYLNIMCAATKCSAMVMANDITMRINTHKPEPIFRSDPFANAPKIASTTRERADENR